MAKEKLNLKNLDLYAFTDPASAKGRVKKVRARQAIIVIACDWLLRVFVIYAWAGRLPTSRYIDKLMTVGESFLQYNLRRFGVEANAMQSLFADVVAAEARKRLKRIPFVGIYQSTKTDKDFRIRTAVEPVINHGRLFILDKSIELEAELRGFPTAATKDLVDCLASAISMIPARPTSVQRNDEIEALADYLRRSGMQSWMVQQRILEIMEEEGYDQT